jgi:hypothetical protein
VNVRLGAGSIHVMRSSDWRALVGNVTSYQAEAHAQLVVLPDSATVAEVAAQVAALKAPPPLPATA